jgi:hypothetical protein
MKSVNSYPTLPDASEMSFRRTGPARVRMKPWTRRIWNLHIRLHCHFYGDLLLLLVVGRWAQHWGQSHAAIQWPHRGKQASITLCISSRWYLFLSLHNHKPVRINSTNLIGVTNVSSFGSLVFTLCTRSVIYIYIYIYIGSCIRPTQYI